MAASGIGKGRTPEQWLAKSRCRRGHRRGPGTVQTHTASPGHSRGWRGRRGGGESTRGLRRTSPPAIRTRQLLPQHGEQPFRGEECVSNWPGREGSVRRNRELFPGRKPHSSFQTKEASDGAISVRRCVRALHRESSIRLLPDTAAMRCGTGHPLLWALGY